MLVQTDFDIIMKKLDKFEEDLKKLENEVKVLNAYVDTQLKNKYHPKSDQPVLATTGCLACGKYDCPAAITNLPCPKGTPYVLSSGSLLDSGTKQQWRVATENEDYEE